MIPEEKKISFLLTWMRYLEKQKMTRARQTIATRVTIIIATRSVGSASERSGLAIISSSFTDKTISRTTVWLAKSITETVTV